MAKRMLIDALHPEEMRVVIADEKQIFDFDFVTAAKKQVKGNIYLAKITRVEPSLQAAFVEYGGGKQGFLPFAEIHADYYQIPVSDRKRLLEELAAGDDSAGPPETETVSSSLTEAQGRSAEQEAAEQGEEAEEAAMAAQPISGLPEAISESPAAEEESAPQPERQRGMSFASSEVVAESRSENAALLQSLQGDAAEAKPEASEEGVETLASDEEEISARRKRNVFFRRYKIQEVIKRGQVVLVQVIKEERGNKGVSLTTYLSLPGRYCVLMPNSPKDGGVSRKISDADTRKRLKELMAELKLANGMSVIIRTAGVDRTRAEIRRDFDYLVKLWNRIRETTLEATAPALIYEESDLIKRAIRDQYSNDIQEVIIEGDEAYKLARDFMKMLLPSHMGRVKHYKESMPLFYAYGVEDQLLSMHDPVVKLRSGGYIVLSPTEALISIDVNSGRATGERNIEETATKTNLEAAAEVARQLRLRDLAGLIVIDFIDMMESRNRRAVERALKDALRSDRAKIQLGRISPFGLLEMSRQRLRPSISETNNVACPHCNGRGHLRSPESMSIQIIRALEKEAATGNWSVLKLNAPEESALNLLNTKRAMLEEIERRYGVTLTVIIDHALTASAYSIEKVRRNTPGKEGRRDEGRRPQHRFRDAAVQAESVERDAAVEEEASEEKAYTAEAGSGEGPAPRARRGRRGGRGRRRGGREAQGEPKETPREPAAEEEPVASAAEPQEEAAPHKTQAPRGPRGPRGRGAHGGPQGRRRWRGTEEDAPPQPEGAKAISPPAERGPGPESLPAFTRAPVMVQPRQPELVVSHPKPAPQPGDVETTARPAGTPPRKGWWQRIIELD
ncbi:MAG: Rne/Rng family ribonuclease [Alphaproteobacteria bacterium]|nr:Rne/Rng family ribonuclease [Alphaproteobacteria bacterium]